MSLFLRNENFSTFVRRFPITSVILAINVVYFVIMKFYASGSEANILLRYGAYDFNSIVNGEYYRFVAPIFMHIDFTHFLFNCFSIFLFASVLERLIGTVRFILLYMISGVVGYVLTFLYSSASLALGASGAIFGIFGAFLYLSLKTRLLDANSRTTVIAVVVMNLVLTFTVPDISITGHLGGLLAGLLLSVVLRINRIRW